MPRKKFFKFRLTRKQKRSLVVLATLGLCIWGTILLFKHQAHLHAPQTPTFHRTGGRPKITFVIDDIGYENRDGERLRKLGSKVTYAILPLTPYSRYFGNMSLSTRAEVILHLPLDSEQGKIPGRGLIVSTMSENDILDLLRRDLESVPYSVGVNNHMGSRGTADRAMMTVILKELKRRKLFFLDSYTTPASVVPKICRSIGLPFLKRGVFLDNDDNVRAIKLQITRLETVARTNGNAIAIGHFRKTTLDLLAQEIPRLERAGFEIITLKRMLQVQRD